MYCTNCGTIIKEGINFCPNCGKKIDNVENIQNSPTIKEMLSPLKEIKKYRNKSSIGLIEKEKESIKKNPILAAFLSFIIPGAGQIYNLEITKGLIYLIISIVVPIMALDLLYENNNFNVAIFANLIMIIYLIFYIYIIVEAYRVAKGQKVWGKDFWRKYK